MNDVEIRNGTEQQIERGRQMVTEKNREAIGVLENAFQQALQNLDFRNAAFALLAQANYYSLVVNDTEKAMATCQRAHEFFDDDESLCAHYEAGLGIAYHLLGEVIKAQRYYQSAINRLEKVEVKSNFDTERLPTLYYNNFILFSYSEDVFGNIEQLNRAIEIYEQQDNQRGILNCLTALANHYHNRTHEHDKALDTILRAYGMAKQIGDASLIGSCCNNAGLYLSRMDRYEEALQFLAEAKTCFKQTDFPFQTGTLHHQTGLAFMHMKRYAEALDELNEAEKIYTEIQAKVEHVKVYELLADVYGALHDFKNAFEYERKFRKAQAENATAERLNAIANAQGKFENEMKEREAQLLRQKNEEIKRYVNKLETSNSELNQFAHVASHDMREPLRMISSYMTLLQKSLKENITEQQNEFIGFALDGAKRMENLIHDLLRLAKVDANPKIESIKLQSVVEEIKLNLDAVLKEKKAIIFYGDLPVINADRTQMLQLFQNLIANGIKYNKGELPTIKVKSIVRENEIEISIADNGCGIPEQSREKVFQIFQRLHSNKDVAGTGMGLAICKKIVESMNGKIWIEENPGGGTIFKFTLSTQY